MQRVFIGLGSNIDREANIRSGIRQLKLLGDLLISPVYESRAYGFDGDNFYNLAARLETRVPPEELAIILREIEDRSGRRRGEPKYSSRTLDLDLLMYCDLIRHDDQVDVPRGDIMNCSFVLRPLADIAGETMHPETGEKIVDIWNRFEKPGQELWPVDFKPDV